MVGSPPSVASATQSPTTGSSDDEVLRERPGSCARTSPAEVSTSYAPPRCGMETRAGSWPLCRCAAKASSHAASHPSVSSSGTGGIVPHGVGEAGAATNRPGLDLLPDVDPDAPVVRGREPSDGSPLREVEDAREP